MTNNPFLIKEVFEQVRLNLPPCTPPWWARSGHLQTILGHLLPSPQIEENGETFLIKLESENEVIHSTYFKGQTKTVVYLFHGLGGNAEASYMQRTGMIAKNMGHHVFINNHRGCGAGKNLANGPYHSGRAEDLSSVIAFGKKMFPDCRHIAIGFSLSANALLLLSAGQRSHVLPDISIAVNAPINLNRASIELTQGLNRIYDFAFVAELKTYVKANRPDDLFRLKGIRNLREFDEVLTAPIGGFFNRSHYYESCSAKKYLKEIKIPTIILTAEDDPFVSAIDYKEAELSDFVFLHIEKHGGHMGYLSTNAEKSLRWQDQTLKAYLEASANMSLSMF
jgi:predicted alpha/beta-fold hydrolase